MARQVLPWVGAAVGFMVGGPAGAQAGMMIGGLIGNAVDPQVINGPKLGEGQDNTASEGGYRPIVLGKGAVGVCMIHEGPLKKRTIRHRQSKGGGPVTTEERAYRTMAFALGESANPDAGVALLRLWIDNKLRYDVTPTSQILQESMEFASQFTFYPGDETQEPDPDLEAFLGAGNVPSYRGGSPYIVFPDWDVTDSRGMAPMIKAEVASAGAFGASMVAFRKTGSTLGVSNYLQIGDYSGPWGGLLTPSVANAIGLPGGRIVTYSDAGNPKYTDDLGETWVLSTGSSMGGSGGSRVGDHNGFGVVIIPGGLSGNIRRSLDNSTSFSEIPGTSGANACVFIERLDRWVFHDYSRIRYSQNDGASLIPAAWIDGARSGIEASFGICAAGTPDLAYFGGRDLDGYPTVAWTPDGVSVTKSTISGVGKCMVTCIATRGDVVVCGTNNGRIIYRKDGVWAISAYSEGVAWNDITHNGLEFVIIGSTDLAGEGVIASSPGGDSWTVRRRSSVGHDERWAAIASSGVSSADADKVPLHTVISWAHDRVNVPESKYDVSELADPVEGVVFADGYTAADAIRASAGWYFFDAGEFDNGSGYRIHYVKRGGPAVATLTESDIVEGPEDWEREDSYERPRVLHVAYQNPVADYGAPTVPIKRTSPDVLVVGERSVNVPFVHSDQDEVARRGDVALTVIYSEIAGKYEITLPVSWLSLAPTDNIGFSIRDRTRRLRMVSWRFSPDGTIKTEWMADRQSAYTSSLTALPATAPTPPPPSIVGQTVSAVLDIPALVDAMDSLHMLVAASGQTTAWHGSIHQIRLPSDSDFATAAQFSAPTTIMGILQAGVSQASQHYTDTTNVVRVKLYSDDELETYTQQQFLSENGAFALAWDDGGVRRWEVCQYRDAVKVGEKEWELSTLMRGRLNTAAAAHPAGSMFVLLDSGIRSFPAQSAWIGQTITHRAVSSGQLPDRATPYTEPYTGASQREWPVSNVLLSVAGSALNVAIVPRHRLGTDDQPMRSLNWTGYRIEATDGTNASSLDTTSESATIDIADWSGTITVTVAQINRITGAGPTVSETIEA